MARFILLLLILHIKLAEAQVMPAWQKNVSDNPFGFEENKGQFRDQFGSVRKDILYVYSEGNFKLLLFKDGFSYQLNCFNKLPSFSEATGNCAESEIANYTVSAERIDAKFKSGSSHVEIIAEGLQEEYSNYYQGQESTYPLRVHKFSKIIYKEIFDQIDLVFYKLNESTPLRYEYIVHPGGNPKNIRIEYDCAGSLTKNHDGDIHISGKLGFIKEENLFVYQAKKNDSVRASFTLRNNVVGFTVAPYDKDQTLVIDPDIFWGTYYGDDHKDDLPQECHVDNDGNILITGLTASDMNFATSGTYQSTYGGGNYDAFVIKWTPAGKRLWCTYFGGSKIEQGFSIYTDANNNVYSSGTTSSNNCPVFNAHQPNYGGLNDNYVLKLKPDGTIGWATYYGGSSTEVQLGIFGDSEGNIYFSGVSYSTNNIATAGSYQPVKNLSGDGFVAKFNSNGVRLWGTYYGGEGDDRFHAVTVDNADNAILVGTTPSTTGIATAGTHQSTLGGSVDAFVVKFSPSGQRIWGSYYGGPDDDHSRECDTDADGNIYVVGFSNSSTGIATADAAQPEWVEAYKNGLALDDVFYSKFDPDGLQLYGTYLGGSGDELGLTLKLQHDNSVIVSGTTQSPGLGTNGVHQSEFAGVEDIFISKFLEDGSLSWFTYYGGTGDDEGEGMDVDGENNIYICGHSTSFTGISTPGAFKSTISDNTFDDGVFARFIDRCFDTHEPNNTSDSATQVMLAPQNFILLQGEISSSNDNDYFSFSNSPALSNIMVTLTNLPKNYDLYLFKPSGAKAGQSVNKKRKNEKIIFNTAVLGTYKIRVQGAGNLTYSDTACYDLSIYLSNTPFKLIDNDADLDEEFKFEVYPNPANDILYLAVPYHSTEYFTLSIYDLMGKEQAASVIISDDSHSIDVSGLRPGTYILHMYDGERNYQQRFVISK